VATDWASLGKNVFQCLKPVLAARRIGALASCRACRRAPFPSAVCPGSLTPGEGFLVLRRSGEAVSGTMAHVADDDGSCRKDMDGRRPWTTLSNAPLRGDALPTACPPTSVRQGWGLGSGGGRRSGTGSRAPRYGGRHRKSRTVGGDALTRWKRSRKTSSCRRRMRARPVRAAGRRTPRWTSPSAKRSNM
jgi:hypothetical protein